MFSVSTLREAGFLILCLLGLAGYSQSSFEVQASYVSAFQGGDIVIWDTPLETDLSHGLDIRAGYSYRIPKTKWAPIFQMGYRTLGFSGGGENLTYKGTTQKVTFALGTRYHLNEKWRVGAYLDAENNLDFTNFRTTTSDLLRYSVLLNVLYTTPYKVNVALGYASAFYPLQHLYLYNNPPHQIRLGLNYSF